MAGKLRIAAAPVGLRRARRAARRPRRASPPTSTAARAYVELGEDRRRSLPVYWLAITARRRARARQRELLTRRAPRSAGTVFKIERGAAGEKIAYVRARGDGAQRDRARRSAKVTAISVFEPGAAVRRGGARGRADRASSGASPTCGSATRSARSTAGEGHHFAPPTLETVVVPTPTTAARCTSRSPSSPSRTR